LAKVRRVGKIPGEIDDANWWIMEPFHRPYFCQDLAAILRALLWQDGKKGADARKIVAFTMERAATCQMDC